MPVWDPGHYLQYADQRSRPFFELTARVGAEEPQTVVDLGCGPGQLTATLADRWSAARVTGIDSSAEMIEAGHRVVQNQRRARFVKVRLGEEAG